MLSFMRFLGTTVLAGRHSGEAKSISNLVPPIEEQKEVEIKLTSDGFQHEEFMPKKYASNRHHGGDNISPQISWNGTIPDGTEEIVLIMEDPSAPLWFPILHAAAILSPDIWKDKDLPEGILNYDQVKKDSKGNIIESKFDYTGVLIGRNSIRGQTYGGPGPLPGHGPHRYVFTCFALSKKTGLSDNFNRTQLIEGLNGKIIGRGRLDGFYEMK
ncbi:hypothetical protein ACTA71_012239 [Dictyostelium dimigraforme]